MDQILNICSTFKVSDDELYEWFIDDLKTHNHIIKVIKEQPKEKKVTNVILEEEF